MPINSYELAKQVMAQRLAGRGAPSGLRSPTSSPPPSAVGQQPLGSAPPTDTSQSRLTPLLEQVFSILVEGNPVDLQAFGEFMARLQDMVQRHYGQGAGQTAQAAPTTPPIA